jgi:hypothetical protein
MMKKAVNPQKPKEKQKEDLPPKTDTSKAIIFDSGVLISFSMNGITDIIKKLKGSFKGKFLITSEIKKEVIDTPLKIKRFKLEALKVKKLLDEGVIEMPSSLGIENSEVTEGTKRILEVVNKAFEGNGEDIHLIDLGESSGIALSEILNEKGIKNVIAIDERTTRVLVENPENLRKFLEKKLHVKISLKKENLEFLKEIRVIRSPELIYVAYKKGLIELEDSSALDALLHAVKYKGASISDSEIDEMKKLAEQA